jgi:hypothetical protein
MAFTRENICPGYMRGHTGTGRCCCGLHWAGTMPLHTEGGVELNTRQADLLEAREQERNIAETSRIKTRLELQEKRRITWQRRTS